MIKLKLFTYFCMSSYRIKLQSVTKNAVECFLKLSFSFHYTLNKNWGFKNALKITMLVTIWIWLISNTWEIEGKWKFCDSWITLILHVLSGIKLRKTNFQDIIVVLHMCIIQKTMFQMHLHIKVFMQLTSGYFVNHMSPVVCMRNS